VGGGGGGGGGLGLHWISIERRIKVPPNAVL